jgi:hypothetical protein
MFYKNIVCVKGKDKKLYVFGVDHRGKKHRVRNDLVNQNEIEVDCEVDDCKISKLCGNDAKKYLPCKFKEHTFHSEDDRKSYCEVYNERPKGDYRREEIGTIAEEYTEEFENEKKQAKKKLKSKVKFSTPKKGKSPRKNNKTFPKSNLKKSK